ncbi:hypothetical protein [Hydrogenophaga sp. PAMC20947]|uniref:hypothetical protein n=1 Tax=Hydrogenophaga sp. PAMC20947 TaxID=2565558 RepID=UPI00109DA383|nr:hypothetical protein [Hydrogenophaga sp. PAMC20947]QCB45685.1 hypothetical protein E5678_06410 [Hydrogenophaga sp. PAMC20947]
MERFKNPLQWLLIVAAGVASYFVAVKWRPASMGGDAVVEAVARSDRRGANTGNASTIVDEVRDASLSLPERERAPGNADGNAFAVLSWLPPPPPPPVVVQRAPAPPPAPVAPPLPFTFVGLMESGGPRPQAFLSKGETLLIVGAGDVIENNTYRVDSLGAEKIVITYLPLNTAQALNIQGANK